MSFVDNGLTFVLYKNEPDRAPIATIYTENGSLIEIRSKQWQDL
jgi:hypothetical protein